MMATSDTVSFEGVKTVIKEEPLCIDTEFYTDHNYGANEVVLEVKTEPITPPHPTSSDVECNTNEKKRFTLEEIEFVEEFIIKNSIIKSKKSDTITIQAKKKCWLQLCKEFNAIPQHEKRTVAQLQKCWDNLKTKRKKELAKEKGRRKETRGKHFPVPGPIKEAASINLVLDQATAIEVPCVDSDMAAQAVSESSCAYTTEEIVHFLTPREEEEFISEPRPSGSLTPRRSPPFEPPGVDAMVTVNSETFNDSTTDDEGLPTQSAKLENHSSLLLPLHIPGKQFYCEQCRKSFSGNSGLNRHLRNHTHKKLFNCDLCAKSFSRHDSLKTHYRTHGGEKQFKCDQCGESFSENGSLIRHLRRHTGEKPFNCELCNLSFSRQENLRRHHRAHTGEKPYKCERCLKSFSRHDRLRLHLRTHTGEKPYNCDLCEKSFSENSTLRTHLRSHSDERANN